MEHQAPTLIQQARECAENGDLDGAEKLLAEARDYHTDTGTAPTPEVRAQRAEIELVQALVDYGRRTPEHYGAAQERLEQVLAGRELPAVIVARAHHLLGIVELRLWQTESAGKHLQMAVTECPAEREHEDLLARIYDSQGQYFEFLGENAEATSAYSCSLGLKAAGGDRMGLAITLNNLGRLAHKLEKWETARRLLETRLRLADELEDFHGRVTSGPLLAYAIARCGELDKSLELLDDIETAVRDKGMRWQLAFLLKVRASIGVQYGGADSALAAAREGAEIFREMGDSMGAAHLERVLGEAHEAAGDNEEAARVLEAAAHQLRTGEDIAEELAALEALARVLRGLGEKTRALAAVDRGLVLANRHGYQARATRLEREREALLLMPGQVELKLQVEWDIELLKETRTLTFGAGEMQLRVTGELGRGAFGVVYSVEEAVTGTQYALKKLVLDGRGADNERIDRFRAEAYATARIEHPHIMKILQIQRDDEQNLYLLMELVDGGDLAQRRFDWREGLDITQKVASALAAAHEEGIVHRDIKPANIMMRGDGEPVLMDFGVAHLPESNRTLTAQILGTLEYLPPQAFAGDVVTAGWDVFALGVSAYELLDGRRPYPSGRVKNGIPAFPDARPVASVCPDLPQRGMELMLAMVDPDEATRPSAGEVAAGLQELLA